MRIRDKLEYKTNDQFRAMREAGLVVAEIHTALRENVRAGVTTKEMDDVALAVLEKAGVKSNFYGYYGYPAQTCISVNSTIVHGIPNDYVLQPGDLVSFDCGAVVNGWHGDAAFSVVLPGGDPKVRAGRERLCAQTEESMWVGIAAMAQGRFVGDIGEAIDDYVMSIPASERPDIVLDYVGHGIGTAMHLAPDVPNYNSGERGPRLKPGMALCIEPMLTAGKQDNKTLADDWTVVTIDGKDACHWEHEVVLHEGGIWVITAPDGGASELARFGVTVAPLG
ncbi:methionyl aminopeptidase [Arcanobacterium wilhelmae]|uniref:Methionine aminopeptidase n=1 Tax=Arcanobacterium wilhelmae TaxID=1803177 RepID=A0ABT9NCM7_9ACTO|nr:type I methionyl aminopeptidase [Arcanobacterium wilhelmae]MDP9801407.1 methionyl aminopeptidase [Arcanobacterium wilhelmae]WFN90741.1 type I methionyl aminopeptidase [Arcanobacterium wilhelmae]